MKSTKTIEIKVERTIPAPRTEVFDAWLDPKVPGTTWNAADKFILDPKVDGLFYWALKGTPHYGRFTEFERPHHVKHTWMSPNTSGLESTVTVTFKPQGENTLMTILHSGLPDTEQARGHERGWMYFIDILREQFGEGSRKPYQWEEAHSDARK
jgi:uncharacterized protein YndB with AHSA1/START domain